MRGVARNVQSLAGDGNLPTLAFRVDVFDAAGNRAQAVGVEFPWYRGGQISDGDEVDVMGRWKGGTLRAERIVNTTTRAQVTGLSGWWKGVAYVFFGLIVLFILYVAIDVFVFRGR